MKPFRIIARSLRDSFKSVVRNFSLSIASILCVTITLILVSVSIIVAGNINNTTKKIESEMTIVVYLNSDVTTDQVTEIETKIKSISKVESVKFKSKDIWKMEMAEYSDTFNTVLNYLDENPLMDSFAVKVYSVHDLSDVANYIKTLDYIQNVKYGEGMVDNIISAFDIVQQVTWVVVIALVVVTAFLISNTIKLTICARKSEIEIMRLVGASNSAIKMPFIFEGFILGLIGSIVPVLATIYGYMMLFEHFNGYVLTPLLTLIKPFNFVLQISLFIILLGAIIGMFGSYRAVRKHLKI